MARNPELYDKIIWAIGRSPCTENLNLSSASVQTDKYGYIPVDKFQKTNIENIFAIGDVIGKRAIDSGCYSGRPEVV